MPLRLIDGDLFASQAEALVNPVNCVGVSGKGLALEFKRRFPHNQRGYVDACKDGTLVPGKVLITTVWNTSSFPHFIAYVPTKTHWRNPSTLELVRLSIEALTRELVICGITSVAVPALGCGNGGLAWDDVFTLMTEAWQDSHSRRVFDVYPPKEI